ncbi:hypothetical protein Y032_0272g951 [Ancylostoma ceylanicum]|uniref:Uncharacterized protein n=1 Tax=Ancylostoma ceylanicum TaxID=53326 RepID=A0A016S893_9BILA|nr:hypothetical protein Y032_0272g951 [Ancylostoma ceylanicum]
MPLGNALRHSRVKRMWIGKNANNIPLCESAWRMLESDVPSVTYIWRVLLQYSIRMWSGSSYFSQHSPTHLIRPFLHNQ